MLCYFACSIFVNLDVGVTDYQQAAETGRWHKKVDRLCHLCDPADMDDEFNYIMSCNYVKQDREFNELFSSWKVIVQEKLCKFTKYY